MADIENKNNPDILFTWQVKIPSLFHNVPLFKNLIFATFIPAPIVLSLIGILVADDISAVFNFFLLGLVIGAAFFILALLVSFIVTRGDVTYYITHRGVRMIAGDYIKNLNRATIAGGALGGSLTATGSGMLAKSREDEDFTWSDAHTIRIFKRNGIIILRRRGLFAPLAIYTTRDNFAEVRGIVLKNCPNARVTES